MSNTLPLTQQPSESPNVTSTPQPAKFNGVHSHGHSAAQSPTAKQSSAHGRGNPLQSSTKSPQVLLSNAVVSPTSILKEGKKLFRNPDTSGPVFQGMAGQDTRGGYHGGGSPFNNQAQMLRNKIVTGTSAPKHANQLAAGQPAQREQGHPQIQKVYSPPTDYIHSNREHHITTFFKPDETYKHPNQLSVFKPNALRQDFKSLEQIEEQMSRQGQALSQNEMLQPSQGKTSPFPHLNKINQMIKDKYSTAQKPAFVPMKNSMEALRPAGYSGPQIAFTQEQLYGQPEVHAALAREPSPKLASILQNTKQMQLASKERVPHGKHQRTQSMGGGPGHEDHEAEEARQANIFTKIEIPDRQISARALKLLRGEYTKSFNTIDAQQEARRQSETGRGSMIKKNEQKKYFEDLEERHFKNTSTVVPSAPGHSPMKPAPIFRQASIWKNLQDKTTLVQTIEESSVMRNKHYQKSSRMGGKENESVFMSEAHKRSLKEGSWNDRSTSIGVGHPQLTGRLADQSKQLPTERSQLLDGGPTINTLRSNNETALDTSQMKKDGLIDTSLLQEMSSKEYHAIDKFQTPGPTAQASFIGQQSAEDQQSVLMNKGVYQMNPDSARGSATFGQEQAPLLAGDGKQTQMNASQELEALHMYDSLLLGNTVSQVQLKEQIAQKRTMNYSISQLKQGSELDMIQASHREHLKVQNFQDRRNLDQKLKLHLERQHQRPQKYLQPIKGGSQHLERRHQSMYSTLDAPINKDAANVTDSSAQSNVQVVDLGQLELETMKGTNIRQLSPITRRLNKLTGATLNQLDNQVHALAIREQLKDKLLMRMKYKGQDVEDSKRLMEKNTKLVKILKNQINSIVAPDEQKYQVILPNCNLETVEVLPQMIPTFLKIPCSLLRSPCQFEVLMNDLDAMHVMLSTEHKFPQEEKEQFEKEKLILKDLSALTKIKQRSQTQDGQQKKKKMSILLIEASSKPKRAEEDNKRTNAKGDEAPAPIKRTFRFAKSNFKETFDEGDMLYVTLISQNGGTIRLKVNFPNSQGGFGAEAINTNEEMKAYKRKKELSKDAHTPAQIEDELHSWFKQNMHLLDSYKHMFQDGALDFMALNKGVRLEMSSYKNLAIEHQRKMWINQLKMDAAKQKAEQNTLYNYYKNKKNLTKWEDYRETKIELTAILIRVLKRKNFTCKWLRIHKAGQIYAKIRQNLYIRRALNHVLYTSLMCAIRFKIDYKYRYQKQYGFSMTKRNQNVIRRALNFGGICKYNTIEEDVSKKLHGFIFNTFLCFNLCDRFTRYNDNLIHVQVQRRHIQMTREYRFLLIYKRMEIIRDILVPIYNKKKGKKYAKKLAQALKKVMDKERIEDYQKVKEQFSLWGTKNMKENQNLFDSIHIRTLTITHQILALATQKNEAGEKIHKEQIDAIKTEIEAQLKRIRLRTKKIDEIDRDLIGITEKEIKEINKKAGGRKPDPKIVKDAAYHKFDTGKIFKDDKLLKSVKTGFMKALTKPKNAPAKGTKGKKGKVADEGQPEDAEGAEGAEGADMEGMDGENAEGEGMDEENADGEGMDGEAPEGDGEAGDGEGAGEGEADGDAAGEDMEGDGADGQEGSAQITQNASAEDLGMDGEGEAAEDGEDDAKSPKKKKGASRSVSKGKKKKKADADAITVIKQKESAKVKKKWILDEKVETPQEILDWIQENYPGERPTSSQEPPQEEGAKKKEPKILSGVDLMTVEDVKAIVKEKYYIVQKKKLMMLTEAKKPQINLTWLTRMLLHLSLNIGPQTKVNEDIEEQLKDGLQNLVLQAKASLTDSPQKDVKPEESKEPESALQPEAQNMSQTQEIKKPPSEPAARSQKSGGSLHPSQCSRKSRKQQQEQDQKSQQSKQSQKDPEAKELDNVFVTAPETIQPPDQEDAENQEKPEEMEEEEEQEEDEEQE